MYYLGIDLGGTNIAIGLCDENLNIIDKSSVPTNAKRKAELIIKDMGDLCNLLVERNGLSYDDIEYIGIASPGAVNSDTGIVEYSNNLPFLNFPIADELKKHTGAEKVLIANDANAAALAEALTASSQISQK